MIIEFKLFENNSIEIHKLKEWFDHHRFDNEYMTPEKYIIEISFWFFVKNIN